jgi:predicted nuclease of predicted toxin-antitoxin system
MKFLIDRCAGRRLAEWIRNQGHDVVESRERGPDPGDRVILQWAAAEGRILVTMDKHFGELVFVGNAPHCGLIRLPDVPADKRIVLMEKVLMDHTRELSQGSVITVRGGRIRISRPQSS